MIFLSELACAARWTNSINALQIPVVSKKKALRPEDLASGLQSWLLEHPAQCPAAIESVVRYSHADTSFDDDASQSYTTTLHEPYSDEELVTLLRFAQSASLIEISQDGIVSFRHELIAAYFVAEYFVALGDTKIRWKVKAVYLFAHMQIIGKLIYSLLPPSRFGLDFWMSQKSMHKNLR